MRLRIVLTAIALAFAAPSTVQAAFVIGAASASADANLGTGTGSPINVIDQSGLSTPYTSGVTDFDTYVASTIHNSSTDPNLNPNAPTIWTSINGKTAGNFDFDLGGTFTIQSFALWNLASGASISSFNLVASSDASFTNTTLLGTFTANPGGSDPTAVGAQVFDFAPTSAEFVRIEIINNAAPDRPNLPVGFGEAVFNGTPSSAMATPAPSSLVLLATGGVFGLAGALSRRLVRPTAAKA